MEVYGLTPNRTHTPKFGTQFENIMFLHIPANSISSDTDQQNPWYNNNIISYVQPLCKHMYY